MNRNSRSPLSIVVTTALLGLAIPPKTMETIFFIRSGQTMMSTAKLVDVIDNQDFEPFDSGFLDVGNGHHIYYEQIGVSTGVPVLFLHGGPGAGCTPGTRRNFNPQVHRAILFDQRASGRSTPHASEEIVDWTSIDLNHHISDIEKLREHLDINSWIVFGVSWGSILGATYAESYPERVTALILGAFSTGTAYDVDWLTVHAGRFFPAEWNEFVSRIPMAIRSLRVVEAYNILLMDPDPSIRVPAAAAWCKWENAHVSTTAISRPNPRFEDPKFQLGFARQVTHCWRHNNWLSDNQILLNADRLANIPGWLIHGRLDLSGPVDASWKLHQAWAGSKLIVVDDEGHGGPKMADHWSRILNELASNK